MSDYKKGITMIELSFLLIFISLVSSHFFFMANHKHTLEKKNITKQRLSEIDEALQAYVLYTGTLPCPAPIVDANHSKFGKESICNNATQPNNIIKPDPKISIGYVPLEALGLLPEHSIDGWGNFIEYRMINELNDLNKFDQNAGKNAGYVLISFGSKGVGAKSWPNNSPVKDCAASKFNKNCLHQSDFDEGNEQNKNLVIWQSVQKLQSIKNNFAFAEFDNLENVDHLLLENNKMSNFEAGSYLVSKNTNYPQLWGLKSLAQPFTLIELNYRKVQGKKIYNAKIINDNYKQNDLIYVKNHGYYVLEDNNGNLEWRFISNNFKKENEFFYAVDSIIYDNTINNLYTDGVYLASKDLNNISNIGSLDSSCANVLQNSIFKIQNKICYIIFDSLTSKDLIYIKDKQLMIKIDAQGILEKKYSVVKQNIAQP